METIKLPKDLNGKLLKPGAEVFVAPTGEKFRIDGFVFGEDGEILEAIEYGKSRKLHRRIPVVLLEVDEPDEEKKKAALLAAGLALALSEFL